MPLLNGINAKSKAPLICACGKEFKPKAPTQRYCTVPCQKTAYLASERARRRAQVAVKPEMPCLECQKPVRSVSRFCGSVCSNRYRNRECNEEIAAIRATADFCSFCKINRNLIRSG